MTFSAYGYVTTAGLTAKVRADLRRLEVGDGPRLREEGVGDLHNFPRDLLPQGDGVYCFSIDEAAGQVGVEYLLDGRDYAPGSQIGLPTQAADRRGLLNSLLAAILVMPDVIRLAIALTDCNEIEGVVVVKPSELAPRVTADCAKCSPPNGLYLCDLVPPELIDAVVPD